MAIQSALQRIQRDFRSLSRFWPFLLIQSGGLAYLAGALILTNSYGFFSWRKLVLALALIPCFYVLIVLFCAHYLLPRLSELSRRGWIGLLAVSILLAGIGYALFPAPRAAIAQPHRLRILVSPERNPLASGGVVEIKQVRFLDGQKVNPERFSLGGDWQIVDGSLYSQGQADAAAELNGEMTGGVSLSFKYQPEAGSVTIFWDGQPNTFDLYAPAASVSEVVLRSGANTPVPLSYRLIDFSTHLLFFLGLFTLALAGFLILRLNLLKPAWVFAALAGALILGVFLFIKLDYPTFIAERTFRDTNSYLVQAEIPLASLSFWAGERSFTLPLLFKILNLQRNALVMSRVFQFQLWFSIICWCALAFAAARSLRNPWVGLLAFGIVLLFGANLETGLWDSLLLTESLSISLFVLLLALWIGWFSSSSASPRAPLAWLYLAVSVPVSVLYAFTRDSNMYFLLISAAFFILARLARKLGTTVWIYTIAMAVLAILHTASLSGGNRWQIFIYDHLAMRILPNPAASAFFVKNGLPLSPELNQITGMVGYEYHDLLNNAPSMQPVRDWVNAKGKTVYIQYLLSRPLQTLLEPLQEFERLANGSGMVYLYPRFLPLSVPERVAWITNLFYSHAAGMLGGLFLLGLAVSGFYWADPINRSPLALLIFTLLISIYPMMFIIWHGEPLEIERHAIQIGIQLRLAGWLAIPVLVEIALNRESFRRWLGLPLEAVT